MTTIACKNCNASFEGNYCPNCGQKNYTEKDKSVKHLVEDAFHFMTHFEGAFFTTLKAIFTKPGQLTIDYCNGVRKKYFKPISFYLLIVILYLIFPIFRGLNIEMTGYKHFIAGQFIEKQIEQKVQEKQVSEKELSEAFEYKSHTVAKFLLLILIPLSALIIALLFFRQRGVFDNFILATEINIFYLFGLFLVLPMVLLMLINLAGLGFFADDQIVGPMVMGLLFIYSSIIFHRVFQARWWVAILKGGLFAFLHTFVALLTYKFLVFEVTFLFL